MRQLKITKQITNRQEECVDSYLNDISKSKTITFEEEINLAKKIKQGDEKSLKKLVTSNLRFVVSVAKQYQNHGLELSDLINEGNIGLIKAAEKFDETKGFKFISYAVWWIRQSILQALAENSRMIRLPQNKINIIAKHRDALSKLEQYLERKPTIEEMVKELKIKECEIHEINEIVKRHISLNCKVNDDSDEKTYEEKIENENSEMPDENLIYDSTKQDIKKLLTILTPKERKIIEMFFGTDGMESMNKQTIAEIMNCTEERIRQIINSSVEKIKNRAKVLL